MSKTLIGLLIVAVLVGMSSRLKAETDACVIMTNYIEQNVPVLNTLRTQIDLQQLDLNSYNVDQHNTPEYIERKLTYDSLVENYNAQVANHNRQIDMYKYVCER